MNTVYKSTQEKHAKNSESSEFDIDCYIEKLVNDKLNEKIGFIIAENKELREKVSLLEMNCNAQVQLTKELQDKLDNLAVTSREVDLPAEVKEINEKLMKMSSENKAYFENNSSVVYHNWIEFDGRINVIVEDIETLWKKSSTKLDDLKARLENLEENICVIKEKIIQS